MESINGIVVTLKSDYAICHITDFSDEIKALLKSQLSFICYGQSSSESGHEIYNYKNTLKEFLCRYDKKNQNIQKGMIGELLSHLIISQYFTDFYVVSPFFNKEERSIKKGFDVVLSAKDDYSIWITEIKSGELHKDKNANETSCDLLGTAKRDLIDRLNTDNVSLWLNAINDAKLAYEQNIDLKNAVVEILAKYGTRANIASAISEINVFLVSALFAPISDLLQSSAIETKAAAIKTENLFKKLFVLSFQKGTYRKVYDFLESESNI